MSSTASAADTYLDACAARAERALDTIAAALRDPHSLVLARLTLSDTTVHCLADGLRAIKDLRDVQLTDVQLSVSSLKELAQVLSLNPGLNQFMTVGTMIGNDGLFCITPLLRTLTRLTLQTANIGNAGAASLAEHLAPATALHHLDLQQNHIKCQGIIALAAAFQINRSLQLINLRGNEVGDSGAVALAKALQQNMSITQLYLGSNKIGQEGATQLAASQSQHGSLTALDLSGNQIMDAGIQAVAQMCKRSRQLTELHLGGNSIGDDGFVALGECLKETTTLQKVDLHGDIVGDAGVASIAAALKVNRSLRQLLVQLDTAHPSNAAAIANALRSNTTITELDLGSLGVDEGTLAAINGTLRVNKFITTIGGGNLEDSTSHPEIPNALSPSHGLHTESTILAIQPNVTSSGQKQSLRSPAQLHAARTPQPPKLPSTSSSPQQRSMAQSTSVPSLGQSVSSSRPVVNSSPSKQSSCSRKSTSSASTRGNGMAARSNGTDPADSPALIGWNKRLEQLAAAMEVRLQAQEAQVIRLANELNSERMQNVELKGKVEELASQLAQANKESAELKEAVAEERAHREKLSQELRWVDEAGVQARTQEEQLRRQGDDATSEQMQAQMVEIQKLQTSVSAFEEASRKVTSELRQLVSSGLEELTEKVTTIERVSRSEIDRLRAELTDMSVSAELSSEVNELARSLEGAQQKLQEEVRWLDEEHMRCRAEDESKLQSMVDAVRADFESRMQNELSKVVQPAQTADQQEALSSLKQTSAKVDELSSAVNVMCSYMESLKMKELAVAATSRTKELEERLTKQSSFEVAQALKAHDALVLRVDELEVALHKEQESSLKALQAILHSQSLQ